MHYTLQGTTTMRTSSSRPDYPAPAYISGTTRDRDQILSQIGGFSHDERRLFHLLCAMWQPEIPYAKALARAEREDPRLPLALSSLMYKLQHGHAGLVLTTAQGGATQPRALLLTAEGSALFYTKLVEEQWQQLLAEPNRQLPNRRVLAEYQSEPPQTVCRPVSIDAFSSLTAETNPTEYYVAVLDLPHVDELLIASTGAALVIPAVLRKLRSCLDNTNLVSLIARFNKTNLNDVKRRIDSSDASAWRAVVDALLENRAELEQSSITLAEDLFDAAAVMQSYIRARIEQKRRQQLSDQQKAELAGEIEALAQRVDGRVLTPQDLKALIEARAQGPEAETRQLRQLLWKRLTEPPAGRHLPRVVTLTETALHRDHVYLVLLQRLSHLADLIRKEYVREMQLLLHSSDRDHYIFFYSFDNWEADIAQRVAARDPLVTELLQQPELVAEAVVHTCRTRLHISDPREIKRSLEVLFEHGGVKPRPYSYLLALDLTAIFEVAYARLGVLRQLMLRLSGRLDLMRQRFSEVSAQADKPGRGGGRSRIEDVLDQLERGVSEPADQSAASAARLSVGSSGGSRKPGDSSDPRWGGMGPRDRRKQPETVNRRYSKKQQESAWQEFERNVRKQR